MDREHPRDAFVPGAALLRAPVLAAMALTAVNDHWLKAKAPGWVTGKLSDFAGLYFFPFLVIALIELAGEVLERVRRRPRARHERARSARAFAVVLVFEGALFAAIKSVPACAAWVERVWGTVLGSPASIAPDPTDLVALVVLPLAWRTARSRDRNQLESARDHAPRAHRRRVRAAHTLLLLLVAFSTGCVSWVRGYEGRPVDYVAVGSTEEEKAKGPAAAVVRSDGVLLVLHPFQVAWLPRVDWLLPGHHERSLEGWLWIENDSATTVRVVAPLLSDSTDGKVPAQARLVRVHGGAAEDERGNELWALGSAPMDAPAILPGEGAWVRASLPFEPSFPVHFELILGWWEGDRERVVPVAYARSER